MPAKVMHPVAARRILRLALGASLSVGFAQLIGWQLSFIAPILTCFILSLPMPVMRFKQGLVFIIALLAPMIAGLALVPFLMHARWVGILLLTVPIFVPIIQSLSFDGLFGLPGVDSSVVVLWFGVLYLVNMQMSFLSPPFGYALFYLRGVGPPEISMATIFKSALVFLLIQVIGLFLCITVPGIITCLPQLAYG